MSSFWCIQCGKIKLKELRHQKICHDCRIKNENYRRFLASMWQDYKRKQLEHGQMVMSCP